MFDILSVLPGKKKRTGSGWYSFNAVCCEHRGHRTDKRGRGGIKFDGATNWIYNCFNCHYVCSFVLGKRFSKKTEQLLKWSGIDQEQIDQWSFESFQQREYVETLLIRRKKRLKVQYDTYTVSPDAQLVDLTNPNHKIYIDYLRSRGLTTTDYPFLVTPEHRGRNKERIIIPFSYKNQIVGQTSRYLDGRIPKYINEMPPGFVFNFDAQKPDWQFCIVAEGVFDALSLNGCGLLHDTINDDQADLLMTLNRKIIVVPDQDRTGIKLCDKALELGFSVSLPEWAPEVKDINDAVIKYGRLATLLSILQHATNSKIKMEIARKKIDKRIHT